MKKLIGILPKIIGFIFLALLFLAFLPKLIGLIPATDEIDTAFIPNVDFQASEFPNLYNYTPDRRGAGADYASTSEPVFVSNYHWLKHGSKYALFYSLYNQGLRSVRDDEYFQKLTIVMPTIGPGEYFIDNKTVRAFYSQGGSAWPLGQWGGPIKSGKVTIFKNEDNQLKVHIQFKEEFTSEERKKITFDRDLTLKSLSLDEASPWFGKKAEYIYGETYR